MFGFQRVGDLLWALGDMRGRGLLAGCTAGRTTLQGEGLQHDDGHSPLLASTNPAAAVYDPAFAYELAVIVEAAVDAMLGPSPQDRVWYLTLYNEPYPMPPLPEGPAGDDVRAGVLAGLYRFAPPPETAPPAEARPTRSASILFSGPLWQAATEAQAWLAADWGVAADMWSMTSATELRRDAISAERWNRLHPSEPPLVPFVTAALAADGLTGPVVAVSDYLRAVPDQISRWVPAGRPYLSLGADGFGRSDAREALRRYFEIDAAHIVVAVLSGLASQGLVSAAEVAEAIRRYDVDPQSAEPFAL
jgi:pyruvate dehydrogenase E1 component